MNIKRIVITGGAGYVGSKLVPALLSCGYEITVLDLFIYGKDFFQSLKNNPNLHLIEGDIRNTELLYRVFQNQDGLIHLACISNDPSFDLNPKLGKSINYDAFEGIVKALKESSIQRFIYASSSSVYGVSQETHVTETTHCHPLTDYSRYKLYCEEYLRNQELKNCVYTIIRPATVCGYAPRLRLDLTVNILTIHALTRGIISVFGGNQLRPHIYIDDMAEAYVCLLKAPSQKIHKEIFNAGYENRSVLETAELIRDQLLEYEIRSVQMDIQPTNDPRSYHINSEKIHAVLDFKAKYTLKDAVKSLRDAYRQNKIIDPEHNTLYYNIKRMKEINLQ